MNPITKLRRSVAAAVVLAMAIAVPTLATNQTAVSAETFTVLPTTTLTGVPPTLAYGTAAGAQTLAAPQFTIAASTNNAAGMTVSIEGSTPPAGVSRVYSLASYTCDAMSNNAVDKTGNGPHVLCGESSATKAANIPVTPKLVIGASAAPGTYTTGTTTVKATEKAS